MPLQTIKGINEYIRLKKDLREKDEYERTGDEDLFRTQSKILQTLINTQHEAAKAIKDSQDVNTIALNNALLPLTTELQRRNDQLEQAIGQLPAITPVLPEFMNVDLDAGLNITDRENLDDMKFELPSEVFKHNIIDETLKQIKTQNRSIGQKLGKGPVGQKVDANEKKIYQSQKQTLEKYEQIIKGLEGAEQFVSTPKKTGEGLKNDRDRTGKMQSKAVDVIYYPNVEELCSILDALYAAKQAGNNGVNNRINSILDELLRVREIDKDEYNNLYKNIFN